MSTFLLIPIIFLIFSKNKAAYICALYVGYVYFAITSITGPDSSQIGFQVSATLGNIIRASLHIGFLLFSVLALFRNKIFIAYQWPLFLCLLYLCAVIMSVGLSGNMDSNELLRLPLLFVMLLNLFIFIPSILQAIEGKEIFNKYLIHLICFIGLFCVISYLYIGNSESWNFRLGIPLNPRVLSEILVLGLILLIIVAEPRRSLQKYALIISFVLLIIWTGSRLAIIFSLLAAFAFLMYGSRFVGRIFGALVLAILLGVMAAHIDLISAFMRVSEEGAVTSGRVDMWTDVIKSDLQFFGQGKKYINFNQKDEEIRLHNGFLETLMSYGVLAMIVSVLIYGWIVFRASLNFLKFPGYRALGTFFLAIYLLLEAFFGTAFLFNLGDVFIMTSVSVLFISLNCSRRLDVQSGI